MNRTLRLLRAVSLPRFLEHRLRTTLTLLGIALGVGVPVPVVLVNRSVMRGFSDTLHDFPGPVDPEVTASHGVEWDRPDGLRAVAGVAATTALVPVTAELAAPHEA